METSASFEARSAPWSYPAESKMGHGGPKRARSWKRRTAPSKAYRLWRSPLLGDTYRPAFSFAMTPLRLAPAGCCSSTRSELCVTGHRLPSAPHEHPGPWNSAYLQTFEWLGDRAIHHYRVR